MWRWLVLFILDFAKEHSLVKPQHVTGIKNYSQSGPTRPCRIRFERTPHCQELGNENRQQGQADRGHRHGQKDCGVTGHYMRQSPELRNLTRMSPLINYATPQEERTGVNARMDHNRTCAASAEYPRG